MTDDSDEFLALAALIFVELADAAEARQREAERALYRMTWGDIP